METSGGPHVSAARRGKVLYASYPPNTQEQRAEDQTIFKAWARAMYGWHLQGREEFKLDVTLDRVGPTMEGLGAFDPPRWFRVYSQFSQGTRTAASGATAEDGRTMVVANFENDSLQQGFISPQLGDLDLDRSTAPFSEIEHLNVGLGLVNQVTPDT
jgi:hypothetical protein